MVKLKCLALLLLAAVSPVLAGSPPNIVLIYADDLGWGDLGSYGHAVVQTPNIDRLADEGLRLTQYYAPSPLCSPSRAGLLTGRTPYRTGIRSWIPDGEDVHLGWNEITMAHLLKQQGYRTAIIGKLHLNGGAHMKDHPQAGDLGFDHHFVLPGGWVKNAAVESRPQPDGLRRGPMYPDNYWRNGKPVGPTSKFSAELVSDEALEWLATLAPDQPFFLYLPYTEVHTPVASPQRFLDMYNEHLTESARLHADVYHWDWKNLPYRGAGEYYANISFLDEQVGRVLDRLEEMGASGNTLVIFTSDNGPVTREARRPWEIGMAGETSGLRGRKGNLTEGGIRVPAIIRYPGVTGSGLQSDIPVTGLDWLPTLASIVGFDLPADRVYDGQSVAAVLRGERFDRHKPLIWTIDTPDPVYLINEWAVRVGPWKLILDQKDEPKFLFNIDRDPYELHDVLDVELEIKTNLYNSFLMLKESIGNDAILRARQ